MTEIDEKMDSFLQQTLVAVLGTIDQEGNSHLSPIWFHWEDGTAYMFTGRDTMKWRHIEAHPYSSLCVDWREPPYSAVILNGPVAEVDRPVYDLVLSMALRYYGEKKGREFADNYRDNPPGIVAFGLTPRRIISTLEEGT